MGQNKYSEVVFVAFILSLFPDHDESGDISSGSSCLSAVS